MQCHSMNCQACEEKRGRAFQWDPISASYLNDLESSSVDYYIGRGGGFSHEPVTCFHSAGKKGDGTAT